MLAREQAEEAMQAAMQPIPGKPGKPMMFDMAHYFDVDFKARRNAPGPNPAALAELCELLQAGTNPDECDACGAAALHVA